MRWILTALLLLFPGAVVADVLVVLATATLSRRHVRHFLGEPDALTARRAVA